MANRMHLIVIGLWILSTGVSSAAIYQTVDEEGNVVFTDEPDANARPVELPPLPTYTAPRYVSEPEAEQPPVDPPAYTSITVQQPEPDATVRDNAGTVVVSVGLQPKLDRKAGHRIQFYLDGKASGEATQATRMEMTYVDRGAHDIEAAVIDSSGKELIRSARVRFYLHRQSVNYPTRVPTTSPPINRGPQ